MKNCGNCAYWQERHGKQGECRAHAPRLVEAQVVRGGIDPDRALWPLTIAGEWCGEHKAKPVKSKAKE